MKDEYNSTSRWRKLIDKLSSPDIGKPMVIALALLAVFTFPSEADITKADSETPVNAKSTIQTSLVSKPVVKSETKTEAAKLKRVWVTAYSSVPDQTDSTPFTTANGTPVHDGVVAANFLPFGTKIKIPSLFGNKIFVVEDRMHPKYSDRLDIWMSNTESAVQFGKRNLEIAIVD